MTTPQTNEEKRYEIRIPHLCCSDEDEDCASTTEVIDITEEVQKALTAERERIRKEFLRRMRNNHYPLINYADVYFMFEKILSGDGE